MRLYMWIFGTSYGMRMGSRSCLLEAGWTGLGRFRIGVSSTGRASCTPPAARPSRGADADPEPTQTSPSSLEQTGTRSHAHPIRRPEDPHVQPHPQVSVLLCLRTARCAVLHGVQPDVPPAALRRHDRRVLEAGA